MANEQATPVADETELQREHREFKARAVLVLHESGDRRDLCYTFDEVLVAAGLPGRDGYYEYFENMRTSKERPALVGESTAEEFETWRRETSKTLYQEAKKYDVYRAEQTLVRAGFLPRADLFRQVPIVIEGSFRFDFGTVEVPEGEDLASHLQRDVVVRRIYEAYRYDDGKNPAVTWKAVVDEAADRGVEVEAVEPTER